MGAPLFDGIFLFWSYYSLPQNLQALLEHDIFTGCCLLKAKLHYASWFEAGRRQVWSQIPLRYLARTSAEPDSVMEFGGKPASSC